MSKTFTIELTEQQAEVLWLYFDGLDAWLNDDRPLDKHMRETAREVSAKLRAVGYDRDRPSFTETVYANMTQAEKEEAHRLQVEQMMRDGA